METTKEKKPREKKPKGKKVKEKKPPRPRKRKLTQRERQALKPSSLRVVAFEGPSGAFGQQAIVATGEPTPPLRQFVQPPPPPPAVTQAATQPPLTNLTVAALRQMARERGVKIPSKALKSDIINLLTPTTALASTALAPSTAVPTAAPAAQASTAVPVIRPSAISSGTQIQDAAPVPVIAAEGRSTTFAKDLLGRVKAFQEREQADVEKFQAEKKRFQDIVDAEMNRDPFLKRSLLEAQIEKAAREKQQSEERTRQEQEQLQSIAASSAEIRGELQSTTSQEQAQALEQQLRSLGQEVLLIQENIQREAVERQNIQGNIDENLRRFQDLETRLQQGMSERQEAENRLRAEAEESQAELRGGQDLLAQRLLRQREKLKEVNIRNDAIDERTRELERVWINPLPRDDSLPEPLPEVVPAPAQSISDFFKGVPSRRVDIVSPVTPPADDVELERRRQQAELMRRVPAGQREGGQFLEKQPVSPLSEQDLKQLDEFTTFADFFSLERLYLRLSGKQGRLVPGQGGRRTPKPSLNTTQLKREIDTLVKEKGELPPEIRDFKR